MSKGREKRTERLTGDVHKAADATRGELKRAEIMTAALAAFSQPIPDYEPNFHHLRHLTASTVQLKSR